MRALYRELPFIKSPTQHMHIYKAEGGRVIVAEFAFSSVRAAKMRICVYQQLVEGVYNQAQIDQIFKRLPRAFVWKDHNDVKIEIQQDQMVDIEHFDFEATLGSKLKYGGHLRRKIHTGLQYGATVYLQLMIDSSHDPLPGAGAPPPPPPTFIVVRGKNCVVSDLSRTSTPARSPAIIISSDEGTPPPPPPRARVKRPRCNLIGFHNLAYIVGVILDDTDRLDLIMSDILTTVETATKGFIKQIIESEEVSPPAANSVDIGATDDTDVGPVVLPAGLDVKGVNVDELMKSIDKITQNDASAGHAKPKYMSIQDRHLLYCKYISRNEGSYKLPVSLEIEFNGRLPSINEGDIDQFCFQVLNFHKQLVDKILDVLQSEEFKAFSSGKTDSGTAAENKCPFKLLHCFIPSVVKTNIVEADEKKATEIAKRKAARVLGKRIKRKPLAPNAYAPFTKSDRDQLLEPFRQGEMKYYAMKVLYQECIITIAKKYFKIEGIGKGIASHIRTEKILERLTELQEYNEQVGMWEVEYGKAEDSG